MKEKLVNLLLASSQISYKQMVFALFICCIIAAYIFMVYRVVTKTVFYSKTFNITMAMMSVITTGIILGMQSSLVISLGMSDSVLRLKIQWTYCFYFGQLVKV